MSIRHPTSRSAPTPSDQQSSTAVEPSRSITAAAPRTFSTEHTDRLRNLLDEYNAACVSGSLGRDD